MYQGLQESPLLLKEVTSGLRCAPSVKHAVVRALAGREKPLQFYEMHEVRSRYRLNRELLEVDELTTWLPQTAASGEEIFAPVEGSA